MKKKNTVKPHHEFDRIIHNGVKVKSTHFSMYGVKTDAGCAQIGIAVGKANGKATVRVRIKRQVRAMIASAMDWSLPVAIIIVIRPNFVSEDFPTMETELHASLTRMKELITSE